MKIVVENVADIFWYTDVVQDFKMMPPCASLFLAEKTTADDYHIFENMYVYIYIYIYYIYIYT